MDIEKYLEEKIKNCTNYQLSAEDNSFIAEKGIENFIYKKLVSKKFRKWSINEEASSKIKLAIHLNISKNEPIKFTFPFGGYKLWRFPVSPEVDWAEFFMLAYYCAYFAPILKAYKPGVELYFSSDDIMMERLDNIPKKDTDAYFDSFKTLLESFRRYFPANLKIDIIRIGDFFKGRESEFEDLLSKKLKDLQKESLTWNQEKKDTKIKTSELNIKWDGSKDWTGLSNKEKQEKIELGPIYHDAYCLIADRRLFNRGEDKILIFAQPINNCIPIGTTKSSMTKFWTGIGIVENREGKFFDRILSPKQWENTKTQSIEKIKSNLISLKNFQEIPVISEKINF